MPVGCHLIDVIPGLKVEDPTAKQQYCYCCKLRNAPAAELICKRNNPTVRTKLREIAFRLLSFLLPHAACSHIPYLTIY